MARIVLIDDDHGPMDLYVRALRESGLVVDHLDNLTEAMEHVRTTDKPADLYLIDIMMPPGDALTLEESNYGLTSGIILYQRLRDRFPDVPVIILTSISNPEILELLPSDSNTTKEAKVEVLPFDLVQKVKERIQVAA